MDLIYKMADSDISKKTLFIDLIYNQEQLMQTSKKHLQNMLRDHNKINSLHTAFNSFDGLAYIIDLNTYKIVFMNKKMETIFGSVIGEYCWDKLQKGQSNPCAFCKNNQILNGEYVPSGIYRTRYQNTVTKQWFQCADRAFELNNQTVVAIKTLINVTQFKDPILIADEIRKTNKVFSKQMMVSIDQEREKISQLLHDKLGGIGTAIKLNAEFLLMDNKITNSKEKISAISDIVSLSNKFLHLIQNISIYLNPSQKISNQTACEVLSDLYNDWQKRNKEINGNISFKLDLELQLSVSFKVVLYHILQEALTNISRHSKASQVEIFCIMLSKKQMSNNEIKKADGAQMSSYYFLKLTIMDNGIGFNKAHKNNLGLVYMLNRIESFGGVLELNTSSLGGAEVNVLLPFNNSQTEDY